MIETFVKSCFSEKYYISNIGNVRRESTGKIYKNRIHHGGNERLIIKELDVDIIIPTEVLSAFERKPYKQECINHKDGDRTNSNLENLEWVEKGHQNIGKPYVQSRVNKSNPCGSVKQLFWGDETILISEDGFIKTNCKDWKKPTVPDPTKNGFVTIWLPFDNNGNKKDEGKGCNHYLHRIIAEAFCKKEEGQTIVRHIDKDRTNNISSNLEWITQEQSDQDRDNSNIQNRKKVYKYELGGEYTGESFDSQVEASKSMGQKTNKDGVISTSGVSMACNGKRLQWEGYEWSEYDPEDYAKERENLQQKAKDNNAINAKKAQEKRDQTPRKVVGKKVYGHVIGTDSVRTGEVLEWKSGKDASECTGIGTANLSTYVKNNKRKNLSTYVKNNKRKEIELKVHGDEKKRKVVVDFSREKYV